MSVKTENSTKMNLFASRISLLRNLMAKNGIAACIIPQADHHQSEYIEDYFKVREFLSGFNGSAGTLVVTMQEAGLWTDSRYYLQATQQLLGSEIILFKEGLSTTPSIVSFLCKKLSFGSVVAIDSFCFSVNKVIELESEFKKYGLSLCLSFEDLERIWSRRPELSDKEIFVHDEKYAGESAVLKIDKVRDCMNRNSADSFIVSALDEIAWLLNVRGDDVDYNPVVRAYVIITTDSCVLFVDENKLKPDLIFYLERNNVRVEKCDFVIEFLRNLQKGSLLFDGDKLNYALYNAIPNSITKINIVSPIAKLKAIKNPVEIRGYRNAMRKDGVALTKFLYWLSNTLKSNEKVSELSLSEKLRKFKSQQADFVSESFATIAAYGDNGAICHYSATKQTNRILEPTGFLLLDTGTHYLDGTTDITRTISLGSLSDQQKKDFTLVLKGHIALATIKFPYGTKGSHLDILARQFLWNEGLNYGHGTGHGVGHFLNVHEGYAWLRPRENNVVYEAGMTMTNEPGLYRDGYYGVRTENVMLIEQAEETDFGNFLKFETLTLCPIDLAAIESSILTSIEKKWLNDYHKEVYEKISPFLEPEEKIWLQESCREMK